MKDLYWKCLDHLDSYESKIGTEARSDAIESARAKIRLMNNDELLELISDVMEKEHKDA